MFQPMTWSGNPAKWLKITAVLELILAAVFLFLGWRNEIVRSGFYLTAGILGGVAMLLLVWATRMSRGYQEARRLKATGIPGQARITGMRQTGVSLNDQPQVELSLEVSTAMQSGYPVTVKEFVPLMLIGVLGSGAPLPVKVDPMNPENVVIEWEQAGGAMGQPVVQPGDATQEDPGAREAEKQRLLQVGVPGTAHVVSSAPTGQTDNVGRPVYNLTLRVEVPGREPMQGPALVGIPPERIAHVEAGDTFPIKVDPANPTNMTADWDGA